MQTKPKNKKDLQNEDVTKKSPYYALKVLDKNMESCNGGSQKWKLNKKVTVRGHIEMGGRGIHLTLNPNIWTGHRFFIAETYTIIEEDTSKLVCRSAKLLLELSPLLWKAYKEGEASLWKAYKEGEAPLWKAYEGGKVQLWNAYEEGKVSLWNAYKEGEAPLWKAYEEEEAPLWKAYEEGEAPLWKAYEEGKAPLWKAYKEGKVQLWNAYKEWEAPLWKAYKEGIQNLLKGFLS